MKFLILRNVHPQFIKACREHAHEVNHAPEMPREEVLKIVHDYEVIIGGSLNLRIDREMIQKASKLKIIGRPGSGLDLIDLEYCREVGIKVLNSPEGNRNAVAEHALGMLLMLLNKLHLANSEVKNFVWEREKNRGFELKGKTVGIIGFGNTGSLFARKLSGMEVRVLSFDKYKTNYTEEQKHVEEVNLEQICLESDIISFHLQHNQETHHYLNTDFIDRCQRPFILINTSRGKIVQTEALIKGLENGKIIGACIDVLENEKPNEYGAQDLKMYQKLFDFPQVVLSPHVAGWTQKSKIGMSMVLFEKIQKIIEEGI